AVASGGEARCATRARSPAAAGKIVRDKVLSFGIRRDPAGCPRGAGVGLAEGVTQTLTVARKFVKLPYLADAVNQRRGSDSDPPPGALRLPGRPPPGGGSGRGPGRPGARGPAAGVRGEPRPRRGAARGEHRVGAGALARCRPAG